MPNTLPPVAPVAPVAVPQPSTTLPRDTNGIPVGGYDTNTDQLKVEAFDGQIVTLGALADTAATADSGSWSLIALTKRLLGRLTANALGGIVTGAAVQSRPIASALGSTLSAASATPTLIGAFTASTAVKSRAFSYWSTSNQTIIFMVYGIVGTAAQGAYGSPALGGGGVLLASWTTLAGNGTTQYGIVSALGAIAQSGTAPTVLSGAFANLNIPATQLAIYAYAGAAITAGSFAFDAIEFC